MNYDHVSINQLSKTIADNSKVLAEFGYAPPLLSKIKSLMSENYSPTNKEVDKEIEKYDFNGKNLQVLLLFTLWWVMKKTKIEKSMNLKEYFEILSM